MSAPARLLWIELQSMIRKAEQNTDYSSVNDKSKRVLEWIMARTQSSPLPVFIQEIVMRSDIASPATIHKSIAELHARDLLRIEEDPSDGRRRRVWPSAKAIKMAHKLDASIDEWVKSIRG
jgi:DNA-binding MarR family transcriptional regulator